MSTAIMRTKLPKKLSKLIEEEGNNEEIHELSYYVNDRVKLIKEVLKVVKPKRIKSMAPDCMKHMDIDEINSMLLEELLGISNKRLKYIFNGQNPVEDSSSSTEPDEEPTAIISLDDVSSDDDFPMNTSCLVDKKNKQVKSEMDTKDNLMSVLELLELQARARAIRSQLQLEQQKNTKQETSSKTSTVQLDDDDEDAIIEIPNVDHQIVITSSDSENDTTLQQAQIEKKMYFMQDGDVTNKESSRKNEKSLQLEESTDEIMIINVDQEEMAAIL